MNNEAFPPETLDACDLVVGATYLSGTGSLADEPINRVLQCGNQGGIRTAAMLGFEVDKRQFVATTTAVALVIDAARVPIYLTTEAHELSNLSEMIIIATVGVVIGTIFGERLLAKVPEQRFRTVVGSLLLLLGLSILVRGHA